MIPNDQILVKGSSLSPAHGKGGARANIFLSVPPSVRKKVFGAKPKQAGKKEGGFGGRNFCPPASVPVPFEQEKSGRPSFA